MKSNCVLSGLFIFFLASATPSRAEQGWTRVTPAGAGFSAESPGYEKKSDTPGHYQFVYGGWSLNVFAVPYARPGLDPDNHEALVRELKALRDASLTESEEIRLKGTSSGTLDGYPTLYYQFEDDECDFVSMLIIAGKRRYEVVGMGPKGSSDEYAIHFIQSFRLVEAKAGSRF